MLRSQSQKIVLGSGAHEIDRGLITIHKYSGLGIQEPDGVGAAFEEKPKHGLILPETVSGRTRPFGPFTNLRYQLSHHRSRFGIYGCVSIFPAKRAASSVEQREERAGEQYDENESETDRDPG